MNLKNDVEKLMRNNLKYKSMNIHDIIIGQNISRVIIQNGNCELYKDFIDDYKSIQNNLEYKLKHYVINTKSLEDTISIFFELEDNKQNFTENISIKYILILCILLIILYLYYYTNNHSMHHTINNLEIKKKIKLDQTKPKDNLESLRKKATLEDNTKEKEKKKEKEKEDVSSLFDFL